MALAVTHLAVSDDFGGSGEPVLASQVKSYEVISEPVYSGGSQAGQGSQNFYLRFYMNSAGGGVGGHTIDWSFASAADATDEKALVDAAIAQTVSSD